MSTKTNKYDLVDSVTGALDRRVFTDQQVYDDEMKNIFGRSWLMVAHESLIPNKNDYFHSYMGEDPIIVTRDRKGKLHTLLNMCRHRGNRIVRSDDGTSKNFMCTYHGWTYSNEGYLEHVPGEEEAYHSRIDKGQLGLIEARVDTYAGIVFACWDKDAPSLEAFLGDARWYLDTAFNRRDCGQQAIGPQKWIEPVNWKAPVDNASDNYHVPVTHISANMVSGRYGRTGKSSGRLLKMFTSSPNRQVFVNGHSLSITMLDPDNPELRTARPSTGARYTPSLAELSSEYQGVIKGEMERRLGSFRANTFILRNHSIFPNGVLGFRLALPRGPLKTEFWSFALYDKDAPQDVIDSVRRQHARGVGVAGINEPDDIDNWRQVSESGRSFMARSVPQDLSMGAGEVDSDPRFPGTLSANWISESNQRNYYERWQEFMNAESWADIHLDPITVNWDGTASLHG